MIVLAKLKSEKYSFESKVGDKFEFTADISVSSKGIFSITIPDELSSIVYSLIPNYDCECQQKSEPLANEILSHY